MRELRQEDGRDLVIYGHGCLSQTLLKHHLLDELRFAVHPLLVGRGQRLARENGRTPMKLLATRTLETGVVVLFYRPAET